LRSKGQGQDYSQTTHDEISTLEGIFSPIAKIHGCILMKHHNYALPDVHDTDEFSRWF